MLSYRKIAMDFPDFDYGKAYPEDGSVKNDKQVLWDDNYVITTELHDNGRIERIIDLGEFNFKDNILSQDGSTWDYRAEFTYRPEVSFLKWGTPPYIDNGDGLEGNYESVTEEVESGTLRIIEKLRFHTAAVVIMMLRITALIAKAIKISRTSRRQAQESKQKKS